MKQFFYSEEREVGKNEDGTPKTEIFTHSFNPDYVIRSYENTKGELIVLLDDGHERADYVQVPKSNGKGIEIKKERRFMQSEIILKEGDVERFRTMLS